MENADYLTEQLNSATSARESFVATMGTDYSRSNLDRLQALQQQVNDAKTRLETQNGDGSNGSNGNGVGHQPASSADMCVVTLIRNGKSDRCLEVRADTTVADIVNELEVREGGWDIQNLTFKRRVGPGQTADISDPSTTQLGEGTHEIWVGNKVAGGQ